MKRLLWLCCLLPTLGLAAEMTTRPLSALAVYPAYRVSATASPVNESQLGMAVGGRIVALPARVGEAVSQGQRLVALDEREYRIAVDRAKAQVALASSRIALVESQVAQHKALAARQFVSGEALRIKKTELAVRRAELAASRQTLAAAELDLQRAVLRAPFDGVVKARLASVGDFVAPGAAVLVLASTGEPEIRASVPLGQVDSLRAAGAWTLFAEGLETPLRLLRVSPLVDRAGQAQEAVFAPLRPIPVGLAGEIRWQGVHPQLPPAFVQRREGRLGVFVKQGEAVEFRELPAAQAGRPADVPTDWADDTPIVDEGRFQIGLERADGAQ
ncbi:MAG: efflux RND transporter periplasmic adaptor subunit [Rhodocyclaceae bacterium]|nr:efflux RND transporter periplasmic adaptor subunit [Rhodocyclaceae bacterium]